MPQPITGMSVSEALTSWLGLTGKLPLKLDEVVVPVVNVGDLSERVFGPGAIADGSVAAGGAGFRSELEISLPQAGAAQGAGVLVEGILFSGMVAVQRYELGPSPGLAAPSAFAVKSWRDTGLRGLPVAQLAAKNTAAATAGAFQTLRVIVAQNQNLYVDLNWILRANATTGLQQGVMIRSNTDNEEIRATVFWRERMPR